MAHNRISTGFVCAVDYAGVRDHSAIGVGELFEEFDLTDGGNSFGPARRTNEKSFLEVIHVQRLPLKYPLPLVNAHLCKVIRQLPSRKRAPVVMCDAGGIGQGAITYLKRDHGVTPISVVVTAGNEPNYHSSTQWTIPKKVLVSSAVVGMMEGRLKIAPDIEHCAVLLDEPKGFVLKVKSSTGNQQFEAETESVHDDVVTVLLYLAHYAFRPRPKPAYFTNALQGYMER
jgi:hypothetical protein